MKKFVKCSHSRVFHFDKNNEKVVFMDNSDFDRSDILTSETGAYDILDIINKAKGEE